MDSVGPALHQCYINPTQHGSVLMCMIPVVFTSTNPPQCVLTACLAAPVLIMFLHSLNQLSPFNLTVQHNTCGYANIGYERPQRCIVNWIANITCG